MRVVARIIILVAVVFAAQQVFGCSCGAITPSEGFDRAQAVFTGTVVKASKSKWTISVQRVWKGEVESLITLHDAHAGTSCASRFLRGVSYLFLVNVESSNDSVRYSPQVCNWTNRLKSDMLRFHDDGSSRWGRRLGANGTWRWPAAAETSDLNGAKHNKSLDASGISGLVIDNLSVMQLTAAASTQTFGGCTSFLMQ